MRILSYKIPETFGERAIDALTMLVKGMLMIFLVLAILMIILMIMQKFFDAKKARKKEVKEEVKAAPIVEAPVAVSEDNGALVAAITAAIAATLAAEQGGAVSPSGFRVVSFKRVGNGSAWNAK
ncbi:MAG: OadG family protein [Clostridia bacterium]|nr:OadG family protein [Clostridia bacterium]